MKRIDVAEVFRAHPFARAVLGRLHDAGFEAVLVGGVVRDAILHATGQSIPFPPTDVDIATSALPTDVRRILHDRPILDVGEEFGVTVVVSECGKAYEVATYRVESEYDGRWPGTIRWGRTLEEDVRRRDLTINGLAATVDGEVIDLVGGVDDLKERLVRAIGVPNDRFREDHLRMLRAVRFVCQIDGQLDPNTADAIRESAPLIDRISQERTGAELIRLLRTPRAALGLALLDSVGLLGRILPELVVTKGVEQPEEYHPEGDVFVHTIEAVRVADAFVRDPIVKLAVCLHDIGKPDALERNRGANMGGHCAIGARMAKAVAQRLRLSKADWTRIAYLVKHHMRIADFPVMGRGKQVRFVSEGENPDGEALRGRYPLFFDLLEVLIADSEASAHHSSAWRPILHETLRVVEHIDTVCGLRRARELIDGHDLVQLGMEPGKALGAVLKDLHDRILSGEIPTRDAALALARAAAVSDRCRGERDA